MREYLLKTFKYNDWANRKLLEAIRSMDDNTEALRLYSHLISAQDKWLNRVSGEKSDSEFAWFSLIFPLNSIEKEWERSVGAWIGLLERSTEEDLQKNISFIRISDHKKMRVKLIDLMLQLNYHSIHHRAQINMMISRQGQKVPVTDYIFTVLEEA
jgi:uncharacterized damage-inducible protein DinB